MKVFMTACGKVMVALVLAGLVLPCRIRAEEVQGSPFRRSEVRQAAVSLQTEVRTEVHSGLRNGRAGGQSPAPHAVPVKKAGSAYGQPSNPRPGPAAEPGGLVQPAATANRAAAVAAGPGDDTGGRDSSGTIDLAALEEELGRILDEGIEEALAEERKSFEKEYARLWDSRSFWRRVAVGEGGAIVACLLGGFLVWNWSSR